MTDAQTVPAARAAPPAPDIRHDWTDAEAEALFEMPFNDFVFAAGTAHRRISARTGSG